MAKDGEFGSIPHDIFGFLIGVYTAPNKGLIGIADADRIAGLAQLAKAEHAAATATKDPHPVTLTMLCIGLNQQVDSFKNAATQAEKTAATTGLLNLSKNLEGLWK